MKKTVEDKEMDSRMLEERTELSAVIDEVVGLAVWETGMLVSEAS